MLKPIKQCKKVTIFAILGLLFLFAYIAECFLGRANNYFVQLPMQTLPF